MRLLAMLGALVALALAASGCTGAQPAAAAKDTSSPVQEVVVTMTDLAFTPATIEVKAGQPVKLTVKNNGVMEHNWEARIGDATVHVDARPSQSASRTFTVPSAGTYPVVCTIAGHQQAGMKGTLVAK